MADDMFAAFRRVVMVGIDLLDAAGVYAWGLDRAFADLRVASGPGPRRANGGAQPALDVIRRSDVLDQLREAGARARVYAGIVNRRGDGGMS